MSDNIFSAETKHDGQLLEVAIDIAVNAGMLLQQGALIDMDSRELAEFIADQAVAFETQWKLHEGEDYIGEVDAFALKVLLAQYGTHE